MKLSTRNNITAILTILIIVGLTIFMTGCTQINSLGVGEGENAFACLRAESGTAAPAFTGDSAGITVEVSSNTDVSAWTAEDWRSLARICMPGPLGN